MSCKTCGRQAPAGPLPRPWEFANGRDTTHGIVCSPCVGRLLEQLDAELLRAARAGRF